MAEEPEEVLPQQGIAAFFRDEEGPVEGAFQFQQNGAEDDRRKADDDHAGEDQHRPAEQGQLVEAHARRAGLEHADDDLDGAGDGGNLYEDDAEQPPVGVRAWRIDVAGERRLTEHDAVRRRAYTYAREKNRPTQQISHNVNNR